MNDWRLTIHVFSQSSNKIKEAIFPRTKRTGEKATDLIFLQNVKRKRKMEKW